MSDDEYEYEYSDNDEEMEENSFEYTDEDHEQQDDGQVALENLYFDGKGLRDDDIDGAIECFNNVVTKEQEIDGTMGPWSYKAIKQITKLHLRNNQMDLMLQTYQRLLDCISKGNVSPNAIEKGINGMLERVAALYQGAHKSPKDVQAAQMLALSVYDATLGVFHPQQGLCKNERLWFKTNLKYGQLLYERNETLRLEGILKDLQSLRMDAGTNSMEIYALQIQLYSRQNNHAQLRATFEKAMNVRGGIPHPRTIALIQELGGKMHMRSREFEQAGKTFFQAFKSYDEAGDSSRLRCLKYLVLASMLHASTINPFDSQEARPYRDDPEITAMTSLVQAFHNNDISTFERTLRQNHSRIMGDEFIRDYIEDLLRTIRTQVLRRVIRPYTRISLQAIAAELNDIPVADVESILVGLILDGSLDGSIDKVDMVLVKEPERGKEASGATKSLVTQKCEAMEEILTMLGNLSTQVTSSRVKDAPVPMRGLVR